NSKAEPPKDAYHHVSPNENISSLTPPYTAAACPDKGCGDRTAQVPTRQIGRSRPRRDRPAGLTYTPVTSVVRQSGQTAMVSRRSRVFMRRHARDERLAAGVADLPAV